MRIVTTPQTTIQADWNEVKPILDGSTTKLPYVEVIGDGMVTILAYNGPDLAYLVQLTDLAQISDWDMNVKPAAIPFFNPLDDLYATIVLDLSAVDVVVAADLDTAEKNSDARSVSLPLWGWKRFVVTVDLVAVVSATTLSVAVRHSNLVSPDVSNADEWAYFKVDNGSYQTDIQVDGSKQHSISFQVWGSTGSLILWTDAVGTRAVVSVQRFRS